MDYNEEDQYLMLSGIQHFLFCRRQWALIHIEQQWEENVKTVEGNALHKKADQPFIREKRGDKLVVRAMHVRSNELKITGICDVVEFVRSDEGVELTNEVGKYLAYPIEYKRGKPKTDESDIMQLTAQALCLEEMLLCEVTEGYIFYNEIKHRVRVPITKENKMKLRKIVSEMYEYYKKSYTPKVKTGSFCKSCSLQDLCLPNIMHKRSVKSYLDGRLFE
ncbi:CRISPR-associated protein Cas4 [Niallia sp. RD1]|uniref:CRISPR-associated protein Cas4 n=1 Tax=Niallia sp. RD1 TaxID=2962858 RepID=UPI0020C1A729|nr:CRISPR-associated protein Cas4 [Niallia sp. RD1]UTI40178.1 CRISPR-associated protein Cas4 [Niallia sp. RD1]